MVKVRIGSIEKELVDKSKLYKELTGTSTVGLIEELLTDFFDKSLLTNDFLELEKPFYFWEAHLDSFFNNGILECSLEIDNILRGQNKRRHNDIFIVNKVPNNLDSFNEEYKKFCYDNNPNKHKGIYIFHKFLALSDNPDECDINDIICLFDYDESVKTLNIEILSEDELEFRIDLATHKEVYDSLLNELKNYKKWIYINNVDEETSERIYKEIDSDVFLDYLSVLKAYEVIEPYEAKIAMKNYLIKTGAYNVKDELKGIKNLFIADGRIVKPTDLRKLFNIYIN